MTTDIEAIRQKLDSIEDEIRRGAFRSRQWDRNHGWGGAGVIFTREKPMASAGAEKGSYPDTKYVTTVHAGAAGWLLNKLRDLFGGSGLLNSISKIEFFCRLADAAIRYLKEAKRKETDTMLLAAMLAEAKIMLREMEEGTFEYKCAAPGGALTKGERKGLSAE